MEKVQLIFFFLLYNFCKLCVYTSMGIFSGVRKLDKPEWTPMMEQALNVIYFLAEHPEKIAEKLVKKIAACLLDKTTQDKATSEEEQGSQDKENGEKKSTYDLCRMFSNSHLELVQVFLSSFSQCSATWYILLSGL